MTDETREFSSAALDEARQLFLTSRDLAPLILLFVGLTGRNGETIKELPVEHQALENKALAVGLIKRRRGKDLSRETVHWQIDDRPSRQLHKPGSYYLLIHALNQRSRQFSGSRRLWSIWVGTTGAGKQQHAGVPNPNHHVDPFGRQLSRALYFTQWAARHQLTSDGGGPLEVNLNRLKTTVEIRTTRAVGGHLPSAARTNSMNVSFLHYLRNDPRVRDWADRILTDAIANAESDAHKFQLRIMGDDQRRRFSADPHATAADLGTTVTKIDQAGAGDLDTLLSSCLDIEHSPHNDGHCRASFELCLRCPNALVLERHLPALLTYMDWLQHRLDTISVDDWCARHGVTWLIISRLILPKFTPAQIQRATERKPTDLPLDLLEGPVEHP
jgi:hypothetical protein